MSWLSPPFQRPDGLGDTNAAFADHLKAREEDASECFMAVGGEKKEIEIMSITRQKVTHRLFGITGKSVIALHHPSCKENSSFCDLLLAATSDGFLFLWHWPSELLLCSADIACSSFVSQHLRDY